MKSAIIGKKVGMTQLFDENGKVIPVTVIQAGPCIVVQKKTNDKDGYSALQIGFEDIALKKLNNPMKGHFQKSDIGFKKHLKEFKLENADQYNVGDVIKVDLFEVGTKVDISGVSKGKGFAGTIKRYNGRRLKMSHGTGPVHRVPGSIGACATPSRVFKNKKMPGHMGNENVTVQGLEVVKVDFDNNLIAVKGAVPGPRNGIVYLKDSIKS